MENPFDKNPFGTDPKTPLENMVNRPAVAVGLPVRPNVFSPNTRIGGGSQSTDPFDYLKALVESPEKDPRRPAIPMSSFSDDKRYSKGTRPGDNWEEAYAQNQTVGEKAFAGITKGISLIGTTVGSTAATVLYGLPASLIKGDITQLWDNPLNQSFQKFNERMDREILPNFYTQQEQDAEWWSTDNWFRANFLFDKVIKNTGFAVGAMIGGNFANAALLRAGSAVGRGASKLASRAAMNQTFQAFTPYLRNTARAFSQGKNAEVAQIATKDLLSKSNLTSYADELATIANTSSKFANFGETTRRTLVAAYSSAGEASMEAIMGGNEMKENLIQKYIEENGIEPTGKDLEQINETVKQFGKYAFFGNMALLGVTEYVQLPYLAGSSWRNSRNAVRNMTDDVIRTGSKLSEVAPPKTFFGKLYKGVKKYGTYVYDPKEMGQEMGQYALSVGATNYFEKANQTDAADGWMDSMLNFVTGAPDVLSEVLSYGLFGRDEKGEGVGALVSKEGIEGGIIGGFTGGLMQARGKYKERQARKSNTKALIDAANNAPVLKDVIKDRINTVNRGAVLQEQQQAAALQNDILESKDLKADLAFNYTMHKVKYGRTDLVLDEINELQKQASTEKGFEELKNELGNQNDTREEFLSRLEELKQFTMTLDSAYEKLNVTYGSQTIQDPDTEKVSRKFSDDAIERMAYATMKIRDYDMRIPELKGKIAQDGILIDTEIAELLNNPESEAVAKKLAEIDAMDPNVYTNEKKEELKKLVEETAELSLRRKKFIDEYNDTLQNPTKYSKPVVTKFDSPEEPEKEPQPKKIVTYKSKRGDVELEVGEEYFIRTIVDYTKDGKEVFRAPIVKVIGQNEDGTIILEDVKTKEIINASPEKLDQFRMGKVRDADARDRFIIDHANKIYLHQNVKDKNGNPVQGRLSLYNPKTGKIAPKGTLYFNYIENGKVKTTIVKSEQLVAQKGYDKAMVRSVTTLSTKETQSLNDLLSQSEEITIDEIADRNDFLANLYESGMKRIQEIERSMSLKKQEIEKITEQLQEITLTKSGQPRKRITANIRKQLTSLSKLKEQLEKQLEDEQLEKEELEYTVPFFKDMISELSEFGEDNELFVQKLKSDIGLLEELINVTSKSISDTERMINHVEELLSQVLDLFNDYIKRLKEENPNIPLSIDALQANLEKFLGEEGAQMFIENRQGFTNRILELESDINEFEQELEIPQLGSKSKSLLKDLQELTDGLDTLVSTKMVKLKILEKFEKFVDEKKQREQEEEKLLTNKKFREAAIKTQDSTSMETPELNAEYEAAKKKASYIIAVGTMGIDRGKPHQTRARIFGANITKFDDVKAVYVNKNNEDKLRLSGLMDLLRTDELGVIDKSIESDSILVLVMVNSNFELLGVDGKPLSDEQLLDAKNHAIFQVKPDPNFTWENGESMFRKGTPENVKKAIIEKYTQERKMLLSQTEIGELHSPGASFGIVEFERDAEGNINYEARNSVESTNLIPKTTEKGNNKLEGTQLIDIPTVSEYESSGLTSFSNAIGRPFLQAENGIVPLLNKKLNEEEANGVFDAILQLSKLAMSSKQQMRSPEAIRLLTFLRGVVYWGIPQDRQGRQKSTKQNSIFFDTDLKTGNLVLFISNKGFTVPFSPTEIQRNKGEIIRNIQEVHNNVNASMIRNVNKSFEQILSVSEDGTIESVIWPNYQSYLLSEHMPDEDGKITTKGKKRTSIPLTTPIRKVLDENDVNRHSIYFYTKDNIDDYKFEELQEERKVQLASTKMSPGELSTGKGPLTGKRRTQQDDIQDSSGFIFDNKTFNDHTTKGGRNIKFSAPDNLTDDNYIELIKVKVTDTDLEELMETVASAYPDESLEEQQKILGASLRRDIYEEIKKRKASTKSAPVQQAPEVPTATVSDNTKTPIEGLNERLDNYGSAKLVLPSNFYEGERPKGRLNAFKDSIAKVADNIVVLADLNLNEFDFLSEQDKKRLDALRPLAEELKKININDISSADRRTVAVEKRYAQLTNQLTNEFVDIIGKHVEQQLGKTISSSKPRINALEAPVAEEGDVQEDVTEPKTITKDDIKQKLKKAISKKKNTGGFRQVVKKFSEGIQTENWKEVEEFIKKALPNVPFYRVKNILQATNGKQYWGMFQDGALYVYENAEVGTAYHEVFEAVWAMFTDPVEKQNLIKEFKSRDGFFVDRLTGKVLKYSEADNQQIKEQLAEEFRDYVQYKKIPSKPKDGRPYIVKLFSDLINVIKAFFLGPQSVKNTKELFKRISKGYYAKQTPQQKDLSYAVSGIIDVDSVDVSPYAEAREKLSDSTLYEVVDEMIYLTMVNLFSTNKSLFSDTNIDRKDLYPILKENIEASILQEGVVIQEQFKEGNFTEQEYNQFMENFLEESVEKLQQLENSWQEAILKFEERLMSYGIEFDENDVFQINDEDRIRESDKYNSHKIDHFRKANKAVKLLLSTMPYVDAEGNHLLSTINGVKLIPVGQVYVNLLNKLSSSKNTDEMIENLRQMALSDFNYSSLYKRLTKKLPIEGKFNINSLNTDYELMLITSFYSTFKKYNSTEKSVSILEDGSAQTEDTPLSTIAGQLRSKYMNNLIYSSKVNLGFFKYDEFKKAYVGDPLKLKNVNLGTKDGISDFLKKVGVDFSERELTKLDTEDPVAYKKLKTAVFGIRDSIKNAEEISKFTKTSVNISRRLSDLAFIKAKLENPIANSTYYNINGDLTQSYIGPNNPSQFFEFISTLKSLTPDAFIKFPQYAYLLTDSFAQGSFVLKKMFTSDRTERKQDDSREIENLMRVGHSAGVINEVKGKSTESAKLNYKDRLIQEINLNLQGWYLNLVPGDSSLEHMIYISNAISVKEPPSNMSEVNKIFKDYFISELNVSRETDRKIVEGPNRDAKDLRFFKTILADNSQKTSAKINKLHDSIVNEPDTKTPEEVYKKYEDKINKALNKFIQEDTVQMLNLMSSYGLITQEETLVDKEYYFKGIEIEGPLSEKEIFTKMKSITVNYMVANIEMHKLIYSDPYQYSDELKRIKNFNSPRQPIIGGQDSLNGAFNTVWNKGYKKGDIGFTDFLSGVFRTVTLKDVIGIADIPGYEQYKETDGSGIVTFKAYRHFRIRAAQWNEAEEKQYRYDVAWEKSHRAKLAKDKGDEKAALKIFKTISQEEFALLREGNPGVQSAYVEVKPIVSGNKLDGNSYNDIVLDKFALYPLSYRVINEINSESNLIKLYDKLQKENIDYVVFDSGRKVGAINSFEPYKDGVFNNTPFIESGSDRNVINIPFDIMSVQTDVPSKEKASVTRGSQMTKLLTMDFMNAGVPIDYKITDDSGNPLGFNETYSSWVQLTETEKLQESELYKEIKNNENLLKAITQEGFNNLIKTLGIEKTKEGFVIKDKYKTATTLRNEILKREVNDNISNVLLQFFDNDVVLESTPAYQQVRNILYSIANREFISPKVTGAQRVQIPSTFFESIRGGKKIVDGKERYYSENLKFYKDEDGKRVAEVMIGRWFDSPLSDQELLKFLNETEEGKRILSGVAFRIPTQKQNSIDRFVIKQFLPKEFGDSVVVPAEIVAKAGSDFDIDKLSMYFKNVKIDKDGYPKLVEFLTDENSTLEERYVEFVKRNTDDYRDILKELNQSSEKIENEQKIKEKFDIVTQARLEKEDYKIEREILYSRGLDIFSKLPKEVKSIYYEHESRLREAGIEGLEKNLMYKRFTEDLVETYKNNKSVQITTSDGIEVMISSKEVLPIFKQMIGNYIQVNESYGVSEELEDKFTALLNSAKSLKEFLNKKFQIERSKIIAEVLGLDSIDKFGNRSIYQQNSKAALENAYVTSSENLISHPLNFKSLTQPNSAEQLKKISGDIVKKTVGSTFDYSNAGNMLNRAFMSRLRHAFVTGKYAIGIAAVNQTNHSLNQRQAVLLDTTRIALSPEDRFWMSNGTIKFEKYNKVSINGRVMPTLSMVKNAERSDLFPDGQDISDLVGQFIDGYVDISKGPWIIELGATTNVSSTWLFLIKLGVPIEDIAYFMNQPVIRDYLKSIENAGYSYIFNDSQLQSTLIQYGMTPENSSQIEARRKTFNIPSLNKLKETVGKNVSKMSAQELDQQRMILFEFLKYAKMGEHLFYTTQGTNFDTANFNDPYLVFKKQMMLEKARNTILVSYDPSSKSYVSAADAILQNSFLGEMAQNIYDFRNSISETNILLSDNKKVREVLQNTLVEYVDLPDREFVKVAQKMVNDFFDWIVQTKNGEKSLNLYIKDILVSQGGITREVMRFLKEAKDENHPLYGNPVISAMEVLPSTLAEVGGANNVRVKAPSNQAIDQNKMIFAFREIRDYLKSEQSSYNKLYEKIVLLSMIQSGLSTSTISFSSILPYEDFQPFYNSVLSRMKTLPNIKAFYELGVFQKNNWNKDDIVPNERAGFIQTKRMGLVYNPAMAFLSEPIKNAISKNLLPKLLTKSIHSRSSKHSHINYSYEVDVPITEQDKKKGIRTQKKKKQEMRKNGNYSYIKRGLFKKVINPVTGKPYIYSYEDREGVLQEYFVYKLVNAWGESFRANEFYDVEKSSILNNGMMKTDNFDNRLIIFAFDTKKGKSLSDTLRKMSGTNPAKEQSTISEINNVSNTYQLDQEVLYEPFSYSEDNFDVYEDIGDSSVQDISQSGTKNKPSGLPAINRTNKKC